MHRVGGGHALGGGFYEVMAESSATLTGLIFVAVSVGSRLFTAATLPTVRTLIGPTLAYFTTTLALSAAMCVPTQTRIGLGAEIGALSLFGLCRLGALLLSVRALHRRLALERRYWVWHIALPAASYFGIFTASMGLWICRPWALNVLGGCVLLLVVIGIINAWEVMLRSIIVTAEEIAMMERVKDR